MKAYKGFNKDGTCRGFLFEEGKTYEEPEAKLCESGFHACENPLDCFRYYYPGRSIYREVDLDATDEVSSEDSKRVGKKITIGAELSVAQICKLHFEYTSARCTNNEAGKDHARLTGGNKAMLSGGARSSLSGGYASSLSGGDDSSLSGGDDSVMACFNGKAKGGIGSIICIANRKYDFSKSRYIITDYAFGIVDGENIKADTWYKCENGKLVEV